MSKRKNPPGKRRTFTDEFKAEVAALVRESGQSVSQVARNLDVSDTAIRGWLANAKPATENDISSDEGSELKRLRAENKRLRQERDILAKATAFFAKESK